MFWSSGNYGAGKTTTFRMLTGDEIMSGGTALVEGFDIRANMNRVCCNVAFSGQFFFSHLETKRDLTLHYKNKTFCTLSFAQLRKTLS